MGNTKAPKPEDFGFKALPENELDKAYDELEPGKPKLKSGYSDINGVVGKWEVEGGENSYWSAVSALDDEQSLKDLKEIGD